MSEIKVLNFNDCIAKDSIPSNKKIKNSEYLVEGKYPIIDQSEKFICGYTNDKNKLYPYNGDLIIFGDHTLRFKYINFPFCVGADGTKVIIPKKEILNTKFFYYQLKSLNLASFGYSRHYKYLCKQKILVPSLEKQKQIVILLENIDNIKNKRKDNNQKTEHWIKSVYLDMFGDPIINDKNFQNVKLGELSVLDMGGTPSTKVKEYYEGGNINWMKSGDIKGDFIFSIPTKITKLGLDNSNAKLYKKGDVVIALNGQGKTRGTTAILRVETASNQSVTNISPNENLLSEYLHYHLKYRYKQIRELTGDNQRSGLNLTILRNFNILLPPIELQKKFSEIVKILEVLSEKQIKSTNEINELFLTTLDKSFDKAINLHPQN